MNIRAAYTDQPRKWDISEEGEEPCYEIVGDIMTVEEYLNCVKMGALIDYDGSGNPMKDGLVDHQIDIYPSDGRRNIPADATHIIWFNK